MRVAKRILITSTTREVLTVKVMGFVEAFCPICAGVGRFLTLDQAVGQIELSTLELIEKMDTGLVHTIETGDGHLLICRKSLGEWK